MFSSLCLRTTHGEAVPVPPTSLGWSSTVCSRLFSLRLRFFRIFLLFLVRSQNRPEGSSRGCSLSFRLATCVSASFFDLPLLGVSCGCFWPPGSGRSTTLKSSCLFSLKVTFKAALVSCPFSFRCSKTYYLFEEALFFFFFLFDP